MTGAIQTMVSEHQKIYKNTTSLSPVKKFFVCLCYLYNRICKLLKTKAFFLLPNITIRLLHQLLLTIVVELIYF